MSPSDVETYYETIRHIGPVFLQVFQSATQTEDDRNTMTHNLLRSCSKEKWECQKQRTEGCQIALRFYVWEWVNTWDMDQGITSLWDRGGRTNDCEVAKDKPVPNLVTRTSPHHPTDYSTVAPAGAASTASVEVESPISDVFNKSMSDSSWYMSSSNPDTWKKVRHQASIAQLEVEQSLFAFAPSNHKKEPFACHDVFTPSPARIF